MARDIDVDVVVVGGGGSGLAAALSASEQGARVMLLEERSSPGGTSNFPAGLFAVESSLQKRSGIALTKEQVCEAMMEYSHYRSSAPITSRILSRSAATIDWLQGLGVEFVGEPQSLGPTGPRTYHLISGGGRAMVKALARRAAELQVDVRLKCTVKQLRKEDERIVGVVAVSNGAEIDIRAGAVILATGGYGANKEWVKRYAGYELTQNLFPTVQLNLTGSGQQLAWDVGAARDGLGLLEIEYDLVGPALQETQLRMVVSQPYLWVNRQGERLGNEDRIAMVSNFAGNVLTRQADKQAFLIFDADTKARMETSGFDRVVPPFRGVGNVLQNLDEQIDAVVAAGNDNVYRTSSLEELCKRTGIQFCGLQSTIQRYNDMADRGVDEQFGKSDPGLLRPVRKAPFYALRINATMLGTLGGVKINSNMEVLDAMDEPVSGLYAAGNIASGMYGDTYCIVFPGTSLCFAVNSGRIAGEHAVEYAKRASHGCVCGSVMCG